MTMTMTRKAKDLEMVWSLALIEHSQIVSLLSGKQTQVGYQEGSTLTYKRQTLTEGEVLSRLKSKAASWQRTSAKAACTIIANTVKQGKSMGIA